MIKSNNSIKNTSEYNNHIQRNIVSTINLETKNPKTKLFWDFYNLFYFFIKLSHLSNIINLPINWFQSIFYQKFISLTKMLTAKKTSIG